MKTTPSQHWVSLVNQTMSRQRCSYVQAWRSAAEAHPAAAALMSAFGRTRQSVQFFNSRVVEKNTPEKQPAGKQLAQFVNEKTKSGMPYGRAWNKACAEHPELVAAVNRGLTLIGDLDNAAVPVAAPHLKAIFRLPTTCSQEEFAAAWHGNGDTLAPINPGKCFAGLVDYLQTTKSLDYDAVINAAKTAYPDLWAMVEVISKQEI